MSKKILYIDMDGVIADFALGMAAIAPQIPLGDGDDYEARSILVTNACIAHPEIFHHLQPIEGGIDAVKQLMHHYDVYFLSTPMEVIIESYTGKRHWLRKYFGADAEKRLILTHRKDLNLGHYLVDDTTRNGVLGFLGEHIHFGTSKYPDWAATLEYLMQQASIEDDNLLIAA
jgi:5'-nucleotidase